jgi:hypothetical protein
VVSYDQNNIAKTVLVTKKGGAPWEQAIPTKTGNESDPAIENMTAYEYRQYRQRVATQETTSVSNPQGQPEQTGSRKLD